MTSPNAQPIPVIPAHPDQHLAQVAQVVSDEFAGGEYVDEIARKYYAECHFDWNTSRLAFDGDQLVHHWGVWGYPMRLGSVELKAAGVGAVVTREPFRNQGLMHRAATASFEAMRANGYDVSILRGRHYHKYGYAGPGIMTPGGSKPKTSIRRRIWSRLNRWARIIWTRLWSSTIRRTQV